jgi:hypothetical protein
MNYDQFEIVFHIEPADVSVGIMSEGYSAWLKQGDEWCDIAGVGTSIEECVFDWYSNDTGEYAQRPVYARIVENALFGFVKGVWAHEEAYNRFEGE